MNTMVTDEQLQDLFESFDNAIKWRDMDIYELNRRGYMGLVSTPNEGAGIPFLKQLVHRVSGKEGGRHPDARPGHCHVL